MTVEGTFAQRLRQIRTDLGISQAKLAKMVAARGAETLDPSAVCRIEQNGDLVVLRMEKGARTIRLGEAVTIADALGVPLSSMLPKPAAEPRGEGDPDPLVVRAAVAAPKALGEFIGDAVAVVLSDHSEDETPDPNIHELAYRVLMMARLGSAGVS